MGSREGLQRGWKGGAGNECKREGLGMWAVGRGWKCGRQGGAGNVGGREGLGMRVEGRGCDGC